MRTPLATDLDFFNSAHYAVIFSFCRHLNAIRSGCQAPSPKPLESASHLRLPQFIDRRAATCSIEESNSFATRKFATRKRPSILAPH